MPRPINSHPTYDRLMKEARNSMRVCDAILETETLEDAKALAAGLKSQLRRYVPVERTPLRRR